MSASNFNLRNVTSETRVLLKKRAAKQKTSINSLILKFIEEGLGISRPTTKAVFHDLDELAGTWSDKDKKAFDENTKSFEKIDKELWL